MIKEKIKRIIVKRFKNLNIKKIILFQNPKHFTHMYVERVNPNHVGIIWGRRKKKLNKGTDYVKLGKVYFTSIPIAYGLTVVSWFDLRLLIPIGFYTVLTFCIYMIMFEFPFMINERFHKCQESLIS